MGLLRIAARVAAASVRTKRVTVYHSTGSIHSLRKLVRDHKFVSVVHDFDPAVANRRLSTATSLEAATGDWYFGPYILEIEAEVPEERRTLATEMVLYDEDKTEFKRWAIGFNYPKQPAELEWFRMSELASFDHSKWDEKVLKESAAGSDIGDHWAMDFFGGEWPELDRVSGSGPFHEYRDAGEDWNLEYRKDLYGLGRKPIKRLDDQDQDQDQDQD